MIYNIHHLHCGTFCPICAPLFGQQGWQAKLVCHCLLLETDQGLVLVDTGLGVEDYLHPKQRLGTLLTHTARIQHDLSQTALKQIQQLGYQASDVQHIWYRIWTLIMRVGLLIFQTRLCISSRVNTRQPAI